MWFSKAALKVLQDELQKIRADQEEVLRALGRVEKIVEHVGRFYSHPPKGEYQIPPPVSDDPTE